MLPITHRIAILLAAALACSLLAPAQAQDGKKLKALLDERLATALENEKLVTARIKNGQGSISDLIDANRLAQEAALDASNTPAARLTVLQAYLAKTKDTEAIAAELAKAGQGSLSIALSAKAERLRAEIAIERAKAAKAPKAIDAKGKPTAYPATIQAHESVRVFARVSGLLTKQVVDIGDRVQRGQALAALDVPTIEAELKQARAVLDQTRARVMESKAKFHAASADLEAAKVAVAQAEAVVKSAQATVQLHTSQLQRMKALFEAKAVEAKLLDESKGKHEAAVEAERVARAQVSTSKAQAFAAQARTDQAKADLAVREAGIAVAAASLEKLDIAKSFAKLAAPFDGVVTQRGYVVGDFIRSADNRGNDPPVFTIQRTDVLRVQIAIAEREAPFLKKGDAAQLEIDAFPNRTWESKVARVAGAVDRKTGTMMVEFDLPNPDGRILPGMTGRVSLNSERR